MIDLLPFVASVLLKSTIVMLLGLAGTRLARRSRAAVRHVALAAAFAALLLVPLVSVVAPSIAVEIPIAVSAQPAPAVATLGDAVALTPLPAGNVMRFEAVSHERWPSWRQLALSTWAVGVVLFLLPIAAGLRQVRALRRSALPWRHAQSLGDRLSPAGAIARRVEVRLHAGVTGPMTCGVVRPIVLLPHEARAWAEDDLQRALVHELEHVRRGDWASGCVARVVCAAYWFHPLVWALWRELSLEAERACDDAVVERTDATAYADQLVVLAERLSAASHRPLLAMANRHDLAARVRAVLDSRQPRGRAGAPRVALIVAASALLVLAVSSLHVVAHATSAQDAAAAQAGPKFDIVSIRPCESEPPTPPGQRSSQGGFPSASPGRFTIECGTVERLIGTAYVRYGEPLTNQAARIGDIEWLRGVPGWLRSEKFTIEAKADGTPEQSVMLGPMLRALLEDRFKLKLHRATDEVPMYEMTVAKSGLKITPDTCTQRDPNAPLPQTPEEMRALRESAPKPLCGNMNMGGTPGRHKWTLGGATMSNFAGTLSTFMDHHVIDKTGVADSFNIVLEFALDEHVPGPDKRYGPPTSFPEPDGPTIFNALEDQLGLKLTPIKGPHGFLVIDHVERPSPNSGPRLLPPTGR